MPLSTLIKLIFKFLGSAFGFIGDTSKQVAKNKGTAVKNEMLEAEIERGDRTEEIEKETVKVNDEGLPSFNYDKFR